MFLKESDVVEILAHVPFHFVVVELRFQILRGGGALQINVGVVWSLELSCSLYVNYYPWQRAHSLASGENCSTLGGKIKGGSCICVSSRFFT